MVGAEVKAMRIRMSMREVTDVIKRMLYCFHLEMYDIVLTTDTYDKAPPSVSIAMFVFD